jgi:LacI family transcriptional regulator
MATEHLLSLGRRSIFHIGGPAGSLTAQERASGTQQALESAGLRSSPFQVVFGDWLEEWGWQAVSHLVESDTDFDALVCGNDQIARGAIDRLIAAGRRIPEDVAVVGFDNWEVLSVFGRHPITSVDLDLQGIGYKSAQALLQGSTSGGGVHLHRGHIVERASTKGHAPHPQAATPGFEPFRP